MDHVSCHFGLVSVIWSKQIRQRQRMDFRRRIICAVARRRQSAAFYEVEKETWTVETALSKRLTQDNDFGAAPIHLLTKWRPGVSVAVLFTLALCFSCHRHFFAPVIWLLSNWVLNLGRNLALRHGRQPGLDLGLTRTEPRLMRP